MPIYKNTNYLYMMVQVRNILARPALKQIYCNLLSIGTPNFTYTDRVDPYDATNGAIMDKNGVHIADGIGFDLGYSHDKVIRIYGGYYMPEGKSDMKLVQCGYTRPYSLSESMRTFGGVSSCLFFLQVYKCVLISCGYIRCFCMYVHVFANMPQTQATDIIQK